MKGFSERNIRSMRLFYEEYKDDGNWQQFVAKLPWGHNLLLIEKLKDKVLRKNYAEATGKWRAMKNYSQAFENIGIVFKCFLHF